MNLLTQFWLALDSYQEYFATPDEVHDDPIYRIRTKAGFMFDDAFWSVFDTFPFRVCHVTCSMDWNGDRIFELRFAPTVEHLI